MSVTYTEGDLLKWESKDAEWNVVVHGCNAQGVMGSGVAKQIRDKYPAAFDVYRKEYEAAGLPLGSFTVAPVENDTKRIVNLVTQQYFGKDGKRYINYEALYSGLSDIRDLLVGPKSMGRNWTLAIPAWIGCGLAGGEPLIVQAMVEDLFLRSEIDCVVVEWENRR